MAPTTRSMSARAAKAAGSKVIGSRISKASKSKTSRSKTSRPKATRSKGSGPKTSGSSKSAVKGKSPPKSATSLSFLSLPGELRNMVYSYFLSSAAITTKEHTISPLKLGITQTPDSFWPSTDPKLNQQIWLIRKSLPIALLFTCRTIYMEVAPLFAPLLTELAHEPLRISAMGGHAAAVALTCLPSPLVACLGAQVPSGGSNEIALNKTGKDFIALCHRPPSSYTTGDVDIELSIYPKHEPQPPEMLQHVFRGFQTLANKGPLRYRVVLHRMSPWALTEPMPEASHHMGDWVDVRELDFMHWTYHANALRRIARNMEP